MMLFVFMLQPKSPIQSHRWLELHQTIYRGSQAKIHTQALLWHRALLSRGRCLSSWSLDSDGVALLYSSGWESSRSIASLWSDQAPIEAPGATSSRRRSRLVTNTSCSDSLLAILLSMHRRSGWPCQSCLGPLLQLPIRRTARAPCESGLLDLLASWTGAQSRLRHPPKS